MALALFCAGAIFSCQSDDPECECGFGEIRDFVISETGEKLLATDNGLFMLYEENGTYELQDAEKHVSLNDLEFGHPDGRTLWLASESGAFNSGENSRLTPENSGLSDERVRIMHFDPQGQVSYYATPSGLDLDQYAGWSHYDGIFEIYTDYEITGIGTSHNGLTFVSTLGGGVERFTREVDGVSGATQYDTNWSGLASMDILCLHMDDTVQAYGTTKGVAIHYSEFTKWNWLTLLPEMGLNADTVWSVVRGSDRRWWFGTTRGLNSYDEDSYEWGSYTLHSHGLLNDSILHLAEDTDGAIWMASPQGLSRLQDGQVTNYPY